MLELKNPKIVDNTIVASVGVEGSKKRFKYTYSGPAVGLVKRGLLGVDGEAVKALVLGHMWDAAFTARHADETDVVNEALSALVKQKKLLEQMRRILTPSQFIELGIENA